MSAILRSLPQKRKLCTPVVMTDDQDTMGQYMGEGEHANFYENRIIGEIDLVGIHPAPEGVPGMDITFTVDEVIDQFIIYL